MPRTRNSGSAGEAIGSYRRRSEEIDDGVKLVVSDDHKGIAAAVRKYLPEAEYQRCTVHLIRNTTQKIPKRLRNRLIPRISELFKAESLERAEELKQRLTDEFRSLVPEAFVIIERGWANATRFDKRTRSH